MNVSAVTDGLRPLGGLIYGVIAFGVVAVGTNLLFFQRLSQRSAEPPFDTVGLEPQEIASLLGWVVYNAHTVAIQPAAARASSEVSINFVRPVYVGDTLLFHLLPAAVLVLAGAVVTRRARGVSGTSPAGAVAGASVAVGYLTAVVAGTFVFGQTLAGVSWEVPLVQSALVAGLAYPVVAGALGGFLAGG